MNTLTETFPAACLIFGLFCGLLALIGDTRERRELNRRAALRRILGAPDLRPRQYMETHVPWKYEQWWKL